MKNKDTFWKSLNQYNNNPNSLEATHHEFKNGVTDDFDVNQLPDKSRRKFLAAVGATAAIAATACTDYYDKGEIISYNKKPDSVTYGKSNYYSTSLNDGTGILVKTREGRPIKIDGNPEHPIFKGKVDTSAQAAILDLYDPGRLRFPIKKSDSKLILYKNDLPRAEWDKTDKEIVDLLKKAVSAGKEIALVTHSVLSPTQKKLFDDFAAKYPTFKVYSYELFNNLTKKKAWEDCYGNIPMPSLDIDKADTIVAIEHDFLGADGLQAETTRKFTSRRNVDDIENFNRLFVVESNYSLTGANADYRFKLKPSSQVAFIFSLINEMITNHGFNLPASFNGDKSIFSGFNFSSFYKENNFKKNGADDLIRDIAVKRGKVLFTAGTTMPYEVHLAVNLINEILGSTQLYNFSNCEALQMPLSSKEELKGLIGRMNSGMVDVLIHFNSNPVYHLPLDYGYSKAAEKVPTLISMLESPNESLLNSKYVFAVNNALESWGDFKLRNGIISTQQPIIAPIHDTRQKEAILLNWIQDDVTKYTHDIYHKYIMENWRNNIFPALGKGIDFNSFWYSLLHDGVVDFNEPAPVKSEFNSISITNLKNVPESGITVILTPAQYLKDGKQANNGWLQEIPHPVSKVVWDNCASISPATAKKYDLLYAEDNNDKVTDVIEIDVNGRKLKMPIFIQPGMVDNIVAVELGYGRTVAGEIGSNVGTNANILMTSGGNISDWIYTGAKITKTGEQSELISTQEHHSLDDKFVKDIHRKRHIIEDYSIPFYARFEENYSTMKKKLEDKYKDNPEELKKELKKIKLHLLGKHEYSLHTIYPLHEYTGVKWAMAIDMNKCTACGVCVASCNVENNIPVVGKEQVGRGREMHWMRIDTYFSGTPEEPITSLQPMLCQHCDKAPCENVCPVVATSHSPDGLNQMTYNRCVGTRYCANNCPFKVRRFNFFDFRDHLSDGYYRKDTLELLNNPEVTVRTRGVMEKCTFCVQRIQEARQDAVKQGRTILGTDVKTACQDACPASAITFGDMNDPKSDVSNFREHPLGYMVLESLNVRPNVTYIAKLRNINPDEEVHGGHH